MSRACLFCGAVGTFTDEHVIPEWLLKYLDLPEDDQLFQGVASTETGELVEAPRIHSTFTFVEGRVCGDCNSGWMSRLEGTAKPILISLMEQRRSLQSLSASEAGAVGKWAAKTAYLHTWAVVSLIWWKSAEGVIIRRRCNQKRLRPLAGGCRRMTPCRTIAGLG